MNKDILKKEHVFLDVEIDSQKDAFKFIAKEAKRLGIVSSETALVKGYENREAEGSTGFEDGFAIPHARIKEAKQAAVFVVRFKDELDWNSMDGKPTKVAIALIIPEGPDGEEHLAMLSGVAMKLMDEKFKAEMNTAKTPAGIIKAMTTEKEEKEVVEVKGEGVKNIVAITACVTGVAHTYMAEEKLLQAGPEMGYNVRVETQGSKGVGTKLTPAEIDAADVVIIAADVNVDLSRFAGKKVYSLKVAKAMKDPKGTIKNALEQGVVLEVKGEGFKTSKNSSSESQGVMKHIMAGISYMIPVIVMGGIALAFSIGLAKGIWGPDAGTDGPNGDYKWGPLNVMSIIGGAAFAMMIPILAGFIGNSIAGRAAIAPAMVAAFLGNNADNFMPMPGMDAVATPAGFLGAIAAGLMAGYAVKWINTWNVPRSLSAAMPIFFIPIVVGLGLGFTFIYVIGGPIGWVMDQIQTGFEKAYRSNPNLGVGVGLALGLALGAMAGFDMGGPINKIAFITGSALVTAEIYEPMGAVGAAIPVAPIAMGLTTILFPRFFDNDTKNLGVAALIMGSIGISEGAIPFAIRDPKRAVVANVLGSAVAGGIAGALGVQNFAAHGGPIVAILGAVPYGIQTLYFFIAVAAGVAVTTSVYGFWLVSDAGVVGSVKAKHAVILAELANNRREAKIEIKEEIASTKANGKTLVKEAKDKNENVEVVKTQTQKQIADLKAKLVEMNETYKAEVLKAKAAYKVNAAEEKEFIKTKTEDIKEFNKAVKVAKNTELVKVKETFSNEKDSYKNKAEEKAAKQRFNEEILKVKSETKTQLDNNQIALRNKFVNNYESQIS